MTRQSVARRYAHALFDVVQKRGTVESAGRELAGFRDVVAGHDDLRRVLESPAVPAPKKHAVIEALLAADGETSPEIARLLLLLADSDRLMLLADIALAFDARAMQARRIVPADVVTAVPLGDERRAALAAALGRAAGCDVTITERVDPSIVGGVIARVGSMVFDGSVARQIERMRLRLLAAGESVNS